MLHARLWPFLLTGALLCELLFAMPSSSALLKPLTIGMPTRLALAWQKPVVFGVDYVGAEANNDTVIVEDDCFGGYTTAISSDNKQKVTVVRDSLFDNCLAHGIVNGNLLFTASAHLLRARELFSGQVLWTKSTTIVTMQTWNSKLVAATQNALQVINTHTGNVEMQVALHTQPFLLHPFSDMLEVFWYTKQTLTLQVYSRQLQPLGQPLLVPHGIGSHYANISPSPNGDFVVGDSSGCQQGFSSSIKVLSSTGAIRLTYTPTQGCFAFLEGIETPEHNLLVTYCDSPTVSCKPFMRLISPDGRSVWSRLGTYGQFELDNAGTIVLVGGEENDHGYGLGNQVELIAAATGMDIDGLRFPPNDIGRIQMSIARGRVYALMSTNGMGDVLVAFDAPMVRQAYYLYS